MFGVLSLEDATVRARLFFVVPRCNFQLKQLLSGIPRVVCVVFWVSCGILCFGRQ